MRRSDRVIGIILGIVIGLVALVLFVFLSSRETIDAPAVDDGPAPATQSQPGSGR